MQQNVADTDVAVGCFKRIVDALPDPLVVLELGACDGYHTVRLAGHLEGRDFRYFAFEPDPDQFETLQRVAPTAVELVCAAVGASDAPRRFWKSSAEFYGSGSLRKPQKVLEQLEGVRFEEAVVDVVTLDGFMARYPPLPLKTVDFIWADIQGAEADMIAGGKQTLARTRWLYTEADGNGLYEGDVNEQEICELLPGFENMGRVGGDLLLRNRAL